MTRIKTPIEIWCFACWSSSLKFTILHQNPPFFNCTSNLSSEFQLLFWHCILPVLYSFAVYEVPVDSWFLCVLVIWVKWPSALKELCRVSEVVQIRFLTFLAFSSISYLYLNSFHILLRVSLRLTWAFDATEMRWRNVWMPYVSLRHQASNVTCDKDCTHHNWSFHRTHDTREFQDQINEATVKRHSSYFAARLWVTVTYGVALVYCYQHRCCSDMSEEKSRQFVAIFLVLLVHHGSWDQTDFIRVSELN